MNPIEMFLKSVSLAALDSTVMPGSLKPWVDKIKERVSTEGVFTKSEVIYAPLTPFPPVFWEYRCDKCLWWVPPNKCEVVEGEIAPRAWCAVWLPPTGVKPLSWLSEKLKGT